MRIVKDFEFSLISVHFFLFLVRVTLIKILGVFCREPTISTFESKREEKFEIDLMVRMKIQYYLLLF